MRKYHYIRSILIVLALVFSTVLPFTANAAKTTAGDLMKITKTVDVTNLVEDDIANVTLSVKGTPKDSTYVRPNDVILIVDKSGSMLADNRLNAAKEATKEFIDLMDLTKHQVGIVDYSTTTSSYPLTTDASAAKAYVDSIQLGGGTETGLAVRKATDMLANHRPEAQPTIVILTDGAANNTADALRSAKAAQDAGIIFYSIALLGPNEDPNTSAPNQLLKDMSTSADHHHFVLGSIGLSEVYKRIVEEIGLASAYNVKITDTISPEFEIVPGSYDNNIPKPKVNGNTLEWDIKELKSKELTFTYQVRAKTTTTAGKYLLGKTSADFEDPEKNNYTVSSTNPIIEVLNPAPVITSINPEKGLTTGGEEVTITGEKFLPGAKVFFGSKEATVLSESSDKIIVTTPTGSQGTVEVKVINPDKQFAIGSFMYYADPTLSYVTPAEGEMKGGNKVIVVGSSFINGAKVFINGIEAETTFNTSYKLDIIVPESTIDGLVSVKVVNPDGTEVEKADAYTYLAPPPAPVIQLDSLSNTSGQLAGGESIYLIGKNFDRGVKAYFGDKEAVVNTYTSSSKIRVNVPQSDTEGFVTVKVVNPDGSSSELPNAYEYLAPPKALAPEIDNLSDSIAFTGEQKTITILGKNFQNTSKVYFGNEEVSVEYITSSRVRVKAPVSSEIKTVDVKLENIDGQSDILTGGFSYIAPPKGPAPEIVSLSDPTALIGEQKTITLFGKNIARDAKVLLDNEEVVMEFVTNSRVRIKIPASAQVKTVDVKLINPDDQLAVLVGGFSYVEPVLDPAPTITSLSGNSGTMAGNDSITITGTNFKKGAKVYFGDKLVTNIVSLTDTEIKIKTPMSTVIGLVSVKVVNPDLQEVVLNDGFTYLTLPITITSLTSTSGSIKGGNSVTIYGTNFNNLMTVTVDGQEVKYTYLAVNRIRIVMPAATTAGTVDIVVDRAGAQASAQYTYN